MTLFTRLGYWVTRYRWPVLIGYLVAMLAFGVFGVQVFGAMKSEGFNDPQSDSSRAALVLAEELGVEDPVALLAIETPNDVDGDAAAVQGLLNQISEVAGVESVISYWSTGGAPAFRGSDGRTAQAIVLATDDANREEVASTIVADFAGQQGEFQVYAFGAEIIGNAFTETITGDLARAESIAIPITALILLFFLLT